MKIAVLKSELAAALAAASGVAPTRTPRPVLEHALLVAKGGHVDLYASDLDVSIRLRLPHAEADGDGSMGLPIRKALQLVRSLEGDKVALSPVDKQVTRVSDDWSRFQLPTWPPSDFPDREHLAPKEPEMWLPRQLLADGLAKVSFCAASEKDASAGVRRGMAIAGALVERKGTRLRVAATDGMRVAIADAAVEAGKDASRILSTKGAAAVLDASEGSERVGITLADKMVTFTTGDGATVACLTLAGEFPDLDRSIPPVDADYRTVEVGRAALADALKRMTVVIDDARTKGVRVTLTKGEIALAGEDAQNGAGGTKVRSVSYDGPEVEWMPNLQFLLAGLGAVSAEKVKISVFGPNPSARPMQVEDGAGWHYLFMPIDLAMVAAESEKQSGKEEKVEATT